MKKRILITGGAGFIGSKIAQKLIEQNISVDIIDNLSTGFAANIPGKAVFHNIDLTKPKLLANLNFSKYCAILHLAAQSSGEKSFENPPADMLVNAFTSALLLQKCLQARVGHFLFASSMAAYGDSPKQPVDEEQPCAPKSFYGCNKLASEKYCEIFQRMGVNTTCFRMFNVYGPGQNLENMKQGMVSIYLAFLLNKKKIMVKGSLDRYRDLVYIDDVVKAWLQAIENPAAYGKIYNIGTGRKTTVRELLEKLVLAFHQREITDKDFSISENTLGDQFGMFADIRRISRDLSWAPEYNLQKGLQEMVTWAKNQYRA